MSSGSGLQASERPIALGGDQEMLSKPVLAGLDGQTEFFAWLATSRLNDNKSTQVHHKASSEW